MPPYNTIYIPHNEGEYNYTIPMEKSQSLPIFFFKDILKKLHSRMICSLANPRASYPIVPLWEIPGFLDQAGQFYFYQDSCPFALAHGIITAEQLLYQQWPERCARPRSNGQ